MKKKLTSIQISTETRDRLYKLKFRKTYDEFIRELCDFFENSQDK
ncbi:MAG: BfmA/BtgA family mobilization protein [Thermoplasmata archaeon]